MRYVTTAAVVMLQLAAAHADAASRPRTYAITGSAPAGPVTLRVYYAQGCAPCYGKLGRAEMRGGAGRALVTLHRIHSRPPNPQRACPQFQAAKSGTVRLYSPLDGPTVIDGSTGKPATLETGRSGG